jgi:hypothetical protein
MTLRSKVRDFMNAFTQYAVATTSEAKDACAAIAADEFRLCFLLMVDEGLSRMNAAKNLPVIETTTVTDK